MAKKDGENTKREIGKSDSGKYERNENFSRDITRMQAPDKWPDPPNDSSDNKKGGGK